MKLGKLQKIKDLRSVWKHEAIDFTKWLAEEKNLNQLGDEIGISIELVSTEAKTGSFSTDILAVEANTNNKIIIENQLEATDHDHLGKIITYASGHDASIIIWIVKEVREEHRQAVDWLNEHTDDEINIFLSRIELWKIADSPIAPKFQIISSPNNWSKTIKKFSQNKFSPIQMMQYRYGEQLNYVMDDEYSNLKSHKPYPGNYYNIPFDKSWAHISLVVNTRSKHITTQVWIDDNKELYDYFYTFKDKIESEIGAELEWFRLDNRKALRIDICRKINIKDEGVWDEAIRWHLGMAERFYEPFNNLLNQY